MAKKKKAKKLSRKQIEAERQGVDWALAQLGKIWRLRHKEATNAAKQLALVASALETVDDGFGDARSQADGEWVNVDDTRLTDGKAYLCRRAIHGEPDGLPVVQIWTFTGWRPVADWWFIPTSGADGATMQVLIPRKEAKR